MSLRVAHVVQHITAESIPIEIAAAIEAHTDVTVRLVSVKEASGSLPDIVDDSILLRELTPVRSYRRLLKELRHRGFDIVHTHHNRSAAAIGLLTRGSSLIHVNTQHGQLHYSLPQRLLNGIILATADALIYNSQATSVAYHPIERFAQRRAHRFVVHNGVNTHRTMLYRAKPSRNIETLVTAARLVPVKNFETLIRALAYLPEGRLKIMGDGPCRSALEALAEKEGVSGRVEFLGFLQDREAVYREMAGAGIFVLASRAEGFCVAAAEAMAVGLPVLVSDLPVFYEVVGEAGVYADPTSPRAFAEGVKALQADPKRADQLGSENLQRVRSAFTLEKTAQGYAEAYAQVCHSASRRSIEASPVQ